MLHNGRRKNRKELQYFFPQLSLPQDLKFGGEESLAIIGDNCTIRECVTINRGTIASGQTT
jgi:acyl-[acyl carrier protein]--UDP-N-acetylglucosamine O-acyltransferase